MTENRASPVSEARSEPSRRRTFVNILVNTAVANLTTSYLWFALTFWIYLETRNVIATGVVGGIYMLLLALSSISFGTLVDRYRKLAVMRFAALFTLVMFLLAGAVFLLAPEGQIARLGGPWFWVFAAVVLIGAVVENMRNIALSTTVTILVEPERRANANGLVGMVQGIAFMVTSVLSGLSIGLLGMGATVVIAVILIALMDPYGLELFSVEMWGGLFALASTGFIVGGAVIGKVGLGSNPLRTMLLVVMVLGLLGALFTIREWLYIAGIWLYMALFPAVEAAEQTVIQRVVPLARQGRVFGFAMAFEASAAPVTAFVVAPLAEFWIIPYARSDAGAAALEPLLGEGSARGIALVFLCAGALMILAAALAFLTPVYRRVSAEYARAAAEDRARGERGEAPGTIGGAGLTRETRAGDEPLESPR